MDYSRYELHSKFSNGNSVYEDILDSGCRGMTASYNEIPFDGANDFSVVGDILYLYYDNNTKVVDMDFNTIIEGNYGDIIAFMFDDKDLFVVSNDDGLYGVVRSSGELVLPFEYFEINRQADKLYLRDANGVTLRDINF